MNADPLFVVTSIFFNILFKYYFFIIFYSFFIFPFSLLCLSVSQPNYSQHRQPPHPLTHTPATTSTHRRRHQPLAIRPNHHQPQQEKKKRKKTHKPQPNWTTTHSEKKPTNQINQIEPLLL